MRLLSSCTRNIAYNSTKLPTEIKVDQLIKHPRPQERLSQAAERQFWPRKRLSTNLTTTWRRPGEVMS